MSECVEPYKECMAARRERVAEAIAWMQANPGTTQQEAADRAGVSQQAIARYISQPVVKCNKREKMQQTEEMNNDPLIQEVNRLFAGASARQRRYIWDVMIPIYFSGM